MFVLRGLIFRLANATDDIRRDVAFAIRMLRRAPGFSVVAVLTLGVAVGVNTTVFTVTNAVLFKGFPLVERNDRLVYITSVQGCCVSYPDYEHWRTQATSFSGMALVHGIPATVTVPRAGAEVVAATEVTANTFRLVGQRPVLGRDFTPADEQAGASVAILRYSAWRRWFGADPRVIGRTIRMNGQTRTVVGVMPSGFSFPQNQDVWVPFVPTPDVRRRDARDTWFVLARLKDGVGVPQARAEMATIGRRLGAAYPTTNQGRTLIPIVSAFEEFFIGASAGAVYRAMWGAVAFVLLIACANLANLLVARGLVRSREIAVRIALGAGRARVVRQLLIESLLLSTLGGLVGWWIARAGVALYARAANGSGISEATFGTWFMNVLEYTIDERAFTYLAAISIGTGILVGLAPALRLSAVDVIGPLKPSGRGATADRGTRRTWWWLVAAEMALAVVLVAGAGMLLRTFLDMYNADPGFDPSRVTTVQLSFSGSSYTSAVTQRTFLDALQDHLQSSTSLDGVALASSLPGWNLASRTVQLEGVPVADATHQPSAGVVNIGGDYFATLGVRLVGWRGFDMKDGASGANVAIVNRQFASRFLTGEAIGRHIRLVGRNTAGPWLTIVGVAPDIVQNRDLQTPEPVVYAPIRQTPVADPWVLVRTRVAGDHVESVLRAALRAVDPDLPVAWGPSPLASRLANNYQYRRGVALVFATFATIALVLASMGLSAVMAHVVSDRTREIGVRTALGGTSRDIVRLVIVDALRPVVCGLTVGIAGSVLLGDALQTRFADLRPSDPAMLGAACAILLTGALIGCMAPMRRALRVDPAVVLRGGD